MFSETSQEYQEFGVFSGPQKYEKCLRKGFLIEHFLYEKDVICISADPGIGKSILALQIMANLTTGTSFLDTFDIKKPCAVLYVQTEGDRAETIDRITSMKKGVLFNDDLWVHINLSGICLNIHKEMLRFVELAKKPNIRYDVMIIDPLYTTVKGSLSNDEVVTDWIRCVREIRKEFGCAVIILNHEPKELFQEGKAITKRKDSIFGSVFWAAFIDHNFKLSLKDGKHVLTTGKQRTGRIIDTIEMRLLEPAPLMYVPADENTSMAQIQIERLLKDELTARQIIEITKLSKATTYRVLKKGCSKGIFVRVDLDGQVSYKCTLGR